LQRQRRRDRELAVSKSRAWRFAIEAFFVLGACGLVAWAACANGPWLERHAHDYRCLRDAALIGRVRVLRAVAVGAALVLVAVVRPRLGRLFERRPPSLGGVARVAVAVVLSPLVVEVYLRKPWAAPPQSLAGCDFCPAMTWKEPYIWALQPSTTSLKRADGREYAYYVNAEGNRARAIDRLPDHTRPTIFVAGESIALGMGLPYEETFGALLEDRTGVQVVNAAVHGYGADQTYERMHEVVETFDKPLAIVSVLVPEQAIRAENEDQPHLRAAVDGGLVLTPPAPEWLRNLRLRAVLKRAIDYHGDGPVDDLRAVARATQAYARARGAYALFLTTNFETPCVDVDGHGPWLFRTITDEQRIPRVNVDLVSPPRVPGVEPHPPAEGHRLLADAVETALRRAHVI
jgi:hypothetical protein